MKYVLSKDLKSELGYYNDTKVPVFETVDEFMNYEHLRNRYDVEKEAKRLQAGVSDEEIYNYGISYVLQNCRENVERNIRYKQSNLRLNIMNKAKLIKEKFFALVETRVLSSHDETCLINQGLCATEEVARECAKYLKEQELINVDVLDKDGINIEDESESSL